MLQEARRYIELGYSVIPLKPQSKEPLVKWQEFTQRKATDAELSAWFGSGENNLGLVTGGASGFVVVDVDGEDGIVSANQLSLASSTVALTGKGRQYFYRPPATPLRNAVRLLPGIDIRSDGGYVCAPPSIHPNGKRYTWMLGPSPVLPDFPSHLLGYTQAKSEPSTGSSTPLQSGWVSEALAGIGEGNRNDTFARVVGKLHHHGLDKTTIWSLLLPYAKACSFEEKELNSVIQSVTRYATDPQRQSDDSDSSIDSFLADAKPTDWLCQPIIAKESINFASGLPETYKTWMLNDLAVECARGSGLWLGLFPVAEGRVLFIDQERSRQETQRRFTALLRAKGIRQSTLKGKLFVKSQTTYRLDLDDSYRSFQSYLRSIQPNLIMVDSFATFQTGDENDRMSVQKVLERIKEIKYEFKCAVVFIDHENKSAFSDSRDGITPSAFRMVGSVGKIAAADSILTVRRYDPSTCMVYHTKNTLGPRVGSFTVHVVDTPEAGIRVYGEQGAAKA